MNSVSLIGRLTKDLELRYTQSGKAVGSFSLAVNRPFTNQQGEREADFIQCVIWGKGAENLANFTRKGSLIGVDGAINTRSYDNQQGQRVYVTEVNVRNFHLLEPRQQTQQAPQGGVNQAYAQQTQQAPQAPQQGYNNPYANQQPAKGQNWMQQEGQPVNIQPDDLPF